MSLKTANKDLLKICSTILLLSSTSTIFSQQEENFIQKESIKESHDSLYIQEVETNQGSAKVLHAEPLYVDLIRDLGARKGEKEWNLGLGQTDNSTYDEYIALIEYEWAPINRLGLEVELPFSFYNAVGQIQTAPKNRLNSIKAAAQYSFWVSEKYKTTMALGYLHEFELVPFPKYGKERLYKGNIYNPFFIAAKRWGNNFHTLLYTGPLIEKHFNMSNTNTVWQINSSIHYMISGTRNFIGIEVNQEADHKSTHTVLRPQMRVGIADNLLIGIVAGIPINRSSERLSSFVRLIYEPGHKVHRN